ncbi:MAG: hypothetical protein GVY02_09520 [Bacteroidetes bacterium]|jgi:hypothetical protein|nr:hypothetical protein [Bacteroidota bacterium]
MFEEVNPALGPDHKSLVSLSARWVGMWAGMDISGDIAVETGDTAVGSSNDLNGRIHAENVAEK